MEYYVLLVFDHASGKLVCTQEYGSNEVEALDAYAKAEAEYDSSNYEVVLIGSDSLETVKRTHANYFEGSQATSKYLAGI
jgi:hypothetical protein